MKKIGALALALVMCFSCFGGTAFGTDTHYKTAMEKTGDYMVDQLTEPAFGQEWFILGLARSGELPDEKRDAYYADVIQEVKDCKGVLHEKKYTEYSRTILALTAIGKDVSDVGGYDLIEKLADFESTIWQGINSSIFALIALDSGGYKVPEITGEGKVTTRQMLIDDILSYELDDGGFPLNSSSFDIDITAMAVQALSNYMERPRVRAAVEKSLDRLGEVQNPDGTYTYWGDKNSESISQVIVALTALDIDPEKDSRFVKNGNSLIDAILTFYDSDGGFRHVNEATPAYKPVVNAMATEQAYYALTAYDRFENGRNKLYDMTDVVKSQGGETELLVDGIKSTKITASSKVYKKHIRISWKKTDGYKVDKYQVYRSKKKNSGFKRIKQTVSGNIRYYKDTNVKKGTRYYYKIRGMRKVDGTNVYTKWSNVVSRKAR